jgi:hypothetical protein
MPPPGTLDYNIEEYSDHGGGSLPEDYPELYDTQDIASTKSNHYFDTERNK